uniref:Uncharacterized protein n=1 Tax=uncultured Armatimonadetes bacterium TaxID=157466 RepID=A0A6J4JCD4_9BACT|nr:hypothetical protein AVDCRST_MAG63-3163 [uncultured Armatimonadetes bacterium]
MRDERHLRGRLGVDHVVAQERRRGLPRDARHERVAGVGDARHERLLDDRRLGDRLHLARVDLGDLAHVLDQVVAAPGLLGDVLQRAQERQVLAFVHGDYRQRDLGLAHARDQGRVVVLVGPAVRDQDRVLDLGVGVQQHVVGGLDARGQVRVAARLDGPDARPDLVLVGGVLHRDDGGGRVVDRDHADLVLRVQRLDRAVGRLARHVGLVDAAVDALAGPAAVAGAHRAAAVDGQREGDAGVAAHLAHVHLDRQRLLDRRLEIAARAERLVAADHGQAQPHVAHARLQRPHLRLRQRGRRHVRQHHGVVVQKLRHLRRRLRGRPHVDVDLLGLERAPQVLPLAARALDVEDARLALHLDEAHRPVVFAQRVAAAGDHELRFVGVEARLFRLLRYAQHVLAGSQRHAMLADVLAVPEQAQCRGAARDGTGDDLDGERLAALGVRRRQHPVERGLLLEVAAQRDHVDRHVLGLDGARRLHRRPGVLVPVAHEHDPARHAGREGRQGEAERAGDVGLRAVRHGHLGDDLPALHRGQGDARVRAEGDDADPVGVAHVSGRLPYEVEGLFALGARQRVGGVHDEQGAGGAVALDPVHPRQRENDGAHDDEAQAERDVPAQGGQVGQRVARGPPEQGEREQQEQQPRLVERDGHHGLFFRKRVRRRARSELRSV